MSDGDRRDELLTTQQVAQHLAVSAHTIRRMVHCGQIPKRQIRGSWRFLRADVDSLLERSSSAA